MDWRVAASVFVVIFLAELGDKTQLTTMIMAAQSKSVIPVFIGAASALVLTSFLGVAFGDAVTRIVPVRYIRLVAGAMFITMGALLILKPGTK
ncbi:MAG TPA: TMEM165/GDT1 family protein [Clostridia bacterium]|nr:TMEM165/GDT1 family protein [Clostridia bacterium]